MNGGPHRSTEMLFKLECLHREANADQGVGSRVRTAVLIRDSQAMSGVGPLVRQKTLAIRVQSRGLCLFLDVHN